MKNIIRILMMTTCVFIATKPTLAQWVQTNGPYGGSMVALITHGSEVFACNKSGLFRSTDDGESWTQCFIGGAGPVDLRSYLFLPNNSGGTNFIGGTEGDGVYLSVDDGTTWTPLDSGLTNSFVWSLAVSGSNIFAGTNTGVFLSTDNGTSWNAVNNGLPTTSVKALVVAGTNLLAGTSGDGMAHKNGFGIYLSTDNGANWTADNAGISCNDINLFRISDSTIFVGTSGGGVYQSTDQGRSWAQISQSGINIQVAAACANPNGPSGSNFFAATNIGNPPKAFGLSTDNGASWDTVDLGLSGNVASLAVAGANLLVGTQGGVFLSTDNGKNWRESNSGLSVPVMCTTIIDSMLFAGTQSGGLYLSSDNGATWKRNGLIRGSIYALSVPTSGADDSVMNFFAATSAGVGLSTDRGNTWTDVSAGLPTAEYRCITTHGSYVFTGSIGNGLYRSSDIGKSWTKSDSGITTDTVFALASDDSCIFAGTMAGLYRSTDSGASWVKTNYNSHEPAYNDSVSIKFSGAWPLTASGSQVFVKNELNLQLSTDNGDTWTIIEGISLSKEGKGDLPFSRTQSVVGSSLSLNDIYSLTASKNFLYAGTARGVWKIPMSDLTAVNASGKATPAIYRLEQNYPNPFNPSTTIGYQLSTSTHVVLKVFDILGREVETLVSDRENAGYHSVRFNATNLPSGVYFYRLQAGAYHDTKKLLLLK